MINILDQYQANANGIHANDPKFVAEAQQVAKYYQFFDGRPEGVVDSERGEEILEGSGQLWKIQTTDYKPTREVRNLTKKLIKKQGRFMLGVAPTLTFSVDNTGDVTKGEQLKGLMTKILNDSAFWTQSYSAFIDSTIGKRVLLMAIVDSDDPERPIRFRYYKMPEFTYIFNSHDTTKLDMVQVVYQDEATIGAIAQKQIWYRWTYEMRGEECWCIEETINGNNVVLQNLVEMGEDEHGNTVTENVELKNEFNTGLLEIPAKVILNNPLTGDTKGHSDVKDLMDMADGYNQVNSDYRDALKFKMFEQPVFIDADSDALAKVKIAPNAVVDLKTDPAIGDGTGTGRSASVTTLSSSFNFQVAADGYLTRLKQDMYEFMDQPLPEQLQNVPSGKALKFLYYDLIGRCEDKWVVWDSVIEWVVNFIQTHTIKFNLYSEHSGGMLMSLDASLGIEHNYPIPEDEEVKKEIAIKEVEANVMSHKTYIGKYGDVTDEDAEWAEIKDEMDEINESSNAGFMDTAGTQLASNEGGDSNGEE